MDVLDASPQSGLRRSLSDAGAKVRLAWQSVNAAAGHPGIGETPSAAIIPEGNVPRTTSIPVTVTGGLLTVQPVEYKRPLPSTPTAADRFWGLVHGTAHVGLLAAMLAVYVAQPSPSAWRLSWLIILLYSVTAGGLLLVEIGAFLQFQLRPSPLLLSALHTAIVLLEAHEALSESNRGAGDVWNRAFLQIIILQVSGLAAAKCRRVGSFVVSLLPIVALLIAESALHEVTDREVGAHAFLLLMGLGAGLLHVAREDADLLCQPWRQALATLAWEIAFGYPRNVEEEVLRATLALVLGEELEQDDLHSRVGDTVLRLHQANELPVRLRFVLLDVFQYLQHRLESLQNNDPMAGLNLDAAPMGVQDFVRENLVQSKESEMVASAWPSELRLGGSQGERSYLDHVQSMMATFQAGALRPQCAVVATAATVGHSTQAATWGDWSFDVFEAAAAIPSAPFATLAHAACAPLLCKLGLPLDKAHSFLVTIDGKYNALPYHSSLHGLDVLNSLTYILGLKSTPLAVLRPLERLTAMVAAATHDVGHDGKNNRFHNVTGSSLAQLYNDQSCLENLHCAITFTVLRSEGNNFMEGLEPTDLGFFRSTLVQMILETDLSKHLQALNHFNQTFPGKDVDKEKLKTDIVKKKQLLSFALKACDVGASSKPFNLHVIWAMRINEEFFAQGDEEERLGIPCSPFCDRVQTDIVESQSGFFDFVVLPLFDSLNSYLLSKRLKIEVSMEMKRNRLFWQDSGLDSVELDNKNLEANIQTLVQHFMATAEFGELPQDDEMPPASEERKPVPKLKTAMTMRTSKVGKPEVQMRKAISHRK